MGLTGMGSSNDFVRRTVNDTSYVEKAPIDELLNSGYTPAEVGDIAAARQVAEGKNFASDLATMRANEAAQREAQAQYVDPYTRVEYGLMHPVSTISGNTPWTQGNSAAQGTQLGDEMLQHVG